MKYYCPRRWYKNVAGKRPVDDSFGNCQVAIVLEGHRRHDTVIEEVKQPIYGHSWYWEKNLGIGTILFFKVKQRAEALVENPSVQLHEVLNARAE